MSYPYFSNKQAELDWLRANKAVLMHHRKTAIKLCDASPYAGVPNMPVVKALTDKAAGVAVELTDTPTLDAELVLNTTNFLDSHGDVHIPGIWTKTLKDNKRGFYLLQEHERHFDKVIAENVPAITKTLTWKELGYDYKGETQALIFQPKLEPERNPYMYEQYAKGRVKEHSVGMYYDQLLMAVNSTEKWWAEEKEIWDLYVGEIINQEDLENRSMFWAVKSARLAEGSAVLMGSNPVTPTLSVTQAKEIIVPQQKNRFRSIGKKY